MVFDPTARAKEPEALPEVTDAYEPAPTLT